MEKFLLRIINQGVSDNQFDLRNQRIVYTNIIYLALPIVYTIFIIIDLGNYLIPVQQLAWDQFIFLVEIAVCAIALYLNKVGHSTIGRLLFILTWPFLLHLIPIWHLQTPTDYYLAYPLGIIFHSVLIQMLFSIRYERFLFLLLMGMNLAMLLSVVFVLRFFSGEDNQFLFELTDDKYYFLDAILYWLLFSLITYLLVNSIDNLFARIISANKLIEEQKEEVATVNEELSAKNESLHDLNMQISNMNENLEETVRARTSEIELQNEKLKEYAFYNAHKLRGPFCRIQGLIALQKMATEKDKEDIDRLLTQSVRELEFVIREIQQIIDCGKK